MKAYIEQLHGHLEEAGRDRQSAVPDGAEHPRWRDEAFEPGFLLEEVARTNINAQPQPAGNPHIDAPTHGQREGSLRPSELDWHEESLHDLASHNLGFHHRISLPQMRDAHTREHVGSDLSPRPRFEDEMRDK